MTQQNYRSSSDDDSNKDHELATGEGKSGGNAGAGKSGKEDLGSEKSTDDERMGSEKAKGGNQKTRTAARRMSRVSSTSGSRSYPEL
jgi:hypothetical protein